MFAIVKTGGKQVKVSIDQRISVEKLEAKIGDEVVLDQVLMVSDGDKVSLGTPLLANSKVKAQVEDQTRTKKIIVFKKKRRQNYRRKKGHRQHQTVLKIIEIVAEGKSLKSAKKPAAAKAAPAKKVETKAAAPKKEAAKPAAKKKAPAKKATK